MNRNPRQFWKRLACATLTALGVSACSGDPLEEARQLQSQGRYDESLEPLAGLLDGSSSPEALFLYGRALSLTNRSGQALWSLRQAMQSPEWLLEAGMQLAYNSTRSGNNDHAIEVLSRILEEHPENLAALELRSYAYAHSPRHYAEALADAERILEIEPGAVRVRNVQAAALLGLDRIEEAGVIIAELEEEALGTGATPGEASVDHPMGGNPDLAGLRCATQAAFAEASGEAEEAAAALEGCLERYPADMSVLRAAVVFFEGRGESEKLFEVLETAHEATGARSVRVSLVLRLQAAGRGEEAEAILRAATEKGGPNAWADLAGFLFERGDQAPALEAYRRAVELAAGRDPTIAFAHAEALVAAGRLDEAEEAAQRLATAHRHLVVGRIQLARKEYASALASLTEGVRLWPDSAVARVYAATAAERLGDFERAVDDYRYAIRSGASTTNARERLARLHVSEGDHLAAYSILLHGGPSKAPTDFDSVLLLTELVARLGMPTRPIPAAFLNQADQRALLVVAQARGARARLGSEGALEVVRKHQLDLRAPANAPALKSVASDLVKLGQGERALAQIRQAIAAQPSAAVFHEALGGTLSELGDTDAAGAAYQRAIALDADRVGALAGLAGLELEAAALESAARLYERAVGLEADNVEACLGRAEVLRRLGRVSDSEQALEALLERRPYDGSAALALARSRSERQADDPTRTLALARAAERFGGGPEAEALVRSLE